MLKLHGFSASNYVNMVKFALLEKGMAFEQVNDYPSQEASFLDISPMGKVPVLETDQGFLAETNVILEYIDETGEGPALYPADPFQRAQVKELAKLIELYIELPARRCYPEVFFGGKVSDETKQQAREALIKGAALEQGGGDRPETDGAHGAHSGDHLHSVHHVRQRQEQRQPAPALRYKALHRHPGKGRVVVVDKGVLDPEIRAPVRHEGKVVFHQQLDAGILRLGPRKDTAVGHAVAQDVLDRVDRWRFGEMRCDHQMILGVAQGARQAADHRRGKAQQFVMRVEHEADHIGAPGAQMPRGAVGLVADLARHALHALARLERDLWSIEQRAGNGGDGKAGHLRDGPQCGAV